MPGDALALYDSLLKISRQSRLLSGISSALEWDQETYMPSGGAGIRAEQLEVMAGMAHKLKTSKSFTQALSKLIEIDSGKILAKKLPAPHLAALREWRRDYFKAKALPNAFVKKFAKLTSQAILVWRSAKKDDAFQRFAPYLEKIVELNRQKAEYRGYGDHPYDALLDDYEPGISTKEVSQLFSGLHKSTAALLKKIVAAKQVDDSFLFGKFSLDKQLLMANKLLEAMGFDFTKGRLDISTHPFSSASHPTDSRVTTRIHADSLMSNLSAALHEGGHSLYEMGLPAEQYGSPLCEPISLAFHESQSRWWETRIGQSQAFCRYLLPHIQQLFGGKLKQISVADLYRAVNKVEPSFIRVEADEVTYNLHVILRFEMEKALIEGSLAIRDVPEAWNAKMQKYLGITPRSNSEGCLQDIHWSMGAFGYFPTYTLGNLYASQLFSAFAQQFPAWEENVAQGDFSFIKQWLNANVHAHGRCFSSRELLLQISQKPFSEKYFTDYIQKKYADIYA